MPRKKTVTIPGLKVGEIIQVWMKDRPTIRSNTTVMSVTYETAEKGSVIYVAPCSALGVYTELFQTEEHRSKDNGHLWILRYNFMNTSVLVYRLGD